jgi:predicted ester cyclase
MATVAARQNNAAELHRDMLDAVQRRDMQRLRSLFDPGYTFTGNDGTVSRGPDAGVANAEKYTSAFPDLTFTINQQHVVSPTVSVIEFTARGTHKGALEGIPATNRRAEVVVCNIIETRGDKVLNEREYFDALSLMRQLGVIGS